MNLAQALQSQRKAVQWVSLTFAAPPSVNATTRNLAGVGRVKTKAYSEWIKSAGNEILMQRSGIVKGPYHITIRVRRASLRKDLGNFEKPISDLLVKMGVIEDDRYAEGIDIRWTDIGEGVSVTVVATKRAGALAA